MCEPIFYFILGSALVIGPFLVGIQRIPKDSLKKEKRSDPTSCSDVIIMIMLQVVMGICLAASVTLAVGLYEDWSEYRLLNEKGEARTVPLLRVEKEFAGKKMVYQATYQFNGSTREQMISKSQYKRLASQNSVDVLAYENTSRIVGSKPEYYLVVPIMVLGAFGGLITGATVVSLLRAIWRRLRPQNNRVW